jgi:hypothetical protein
MMARAPRKKAPAKAADKGDEALLLRTRFINSFESLLRIAIDVTGPAPTPGNPVRDYPRTGGTLYWFSEHGAVPHVLRVLSITDGSLVDFADLSGPSQNSTTGEFYKQVNVPAGATGTDYWFEVGLRITSGMNRQHNAHRFRVRIT